MRVAFVCLLLLAVASGLSSGSPARRASGSGKQVTFEEVTPRQSGISWVHNNAHSTERHLPETVGAGSACLDYDNDGKLDLFVSSFVEYDRTKNVLCTDDLNKRYYCIPRNYKPRPSHLFHNNGKGTFTDVSRESGIADYPGKSFGAVATDVNNDGLMDLFVATD